MLYNKLLCIKLPETFPVSAHLDFVSSAREVLLNPTSDSWREFGGASNLIGWRYRASYEAMKDYINSWRVHGANIDHEEIYGREKALFGMFSSGLSCIDSTCYAVHAFASHPAALGLEFGATQQRSVSMSRLRDVLAPHKSAAELCDTLSDILQSKQWKLWTNFRNRMTHRSNLPVTIFAAAGGKLPPAKALQFAPTYSTLALEAEESHMEELFHFLTEALTNVMRGATTLATAT